VSSIVSPSPHIARPHLRNAELSAWRARHATFTQHRRERTRTTRRGLRQHCGYAAFLKTYTWAAAVWRAQLAAWGEGELLKSGGASRRDAASCVYRCGRKRPPSTVHRAVSPVIKRS